MFWKRTTVIVSLAMAVLLVAALAYAASGSDDSPSTTSTTTSTTLGQVTPTGSQVFGAGAAGRVTVSAGADGLSVDGVDPAAGWVYEVETPAGPEVEVKFADGGERVDFQAELEDGRIESRVRTEAIQGDDRSTGFTMAGIGETVSYDADGAGRVQIRRTATGLELIDAAPASGWGVAKIEHHAHEIEVEFRNGATELEFKAELEDGMVRTRTETSVDEDDGGPDDDAAEVDDLDNEGTDDPADHDDDDGPDGDGEDDDSGDDSTG